MKKLSKRGQREHLYVFNPLSPIPSQGRGLNKLKIPRAPGIRNTEGPQVCLFFQGQIYFFLSFFQGQICFFFILVYIGY